METSNIMNIIDILLENSSSEECAVILKEVIIQCKSRVECCEEEDYAN